LSAPSLAAGFTCGIKISESSGFLRLLGLFGIFDRAHRTGRKTADLSLVTTEH